MKLTRGYLLPVLFFLLIQCSPKYYQSTDFAQKTAAHKKIAVLPVEMILTGKIPENMTKEDIAKVEETESTTFQMTLYNNILHHSHTSKGTLSVDLQPYEKTNAILKGDSISLRESWNMDVQKLAKLLGVDAVVKTRVEKTRYMSDLVSKTIAAGKAIFGKDIPVNSKTNDIDIQSSLFNGADGSLLWKDMAKSSSDWNSSSEVVIQQLTDQFGKDFPYRKK